MKKKGFTLIELLAVIVILAIIALIATPIIMNVIENAKKGAAERSVDNYIGAVETAVAVEEMNGKTVKGEYVIGEDGNLCPADVTCTDDNKVEIEISGNKPTGGTIVIENGLVTTDSNMSIGEYTVSYDKEKGFYVAKIIPMPVSFAEDDWNTIVANVKVGNLSAYKVGDEKEVTLDGFGTYTVRIANTSTPEECSTEGFSQTACGFVVEFVDIITTHGMNSTNTNVGGWEASEMRTYVNDNIYNAFPAEVKNNIIDTYVVSGHGSTSEEENFATTDKVYLLSTKEVFGKEETIYNVINYDTSEEETRQLDYYKSIGTTTNIYSDTLKLYNGYGQNWWLRTACSYAEDTFYSVHVMVGWAEYKAAGGEGVAIAFRM